MSRCIAQIYLRHQQGRNSFVRDNCHLLAGTVLPEGAVVPPFTVVSMSGPFSFYAACLQRAYICAFAALELCVCAPERLRPIFAAHPQWQRAVRASPVKTRCDVF